MVRIIIALAMMLSLSGCFFDSYFVKTKEVYVPLLYCPAPVIPPRPVLPIEQMTPEQRANDGEVVKHYKASVVVLEGYAVELEKSLGQVDKNNKAYEELKKQLMIDIERLKAEQAAIEKKK